MDQTKFIENSQNCKQTDEFSDIKNRQTRHRAPKHILLGQKSEKYGNQVHFFVILEEYRKFAHNKSVQNRCDAFPNRLMRFRIEAKPIWETNQSHCKNAVIN